MQKSPPKDRTRHFTGDLYTPLNALNPPSTGTTIPVTKEEASGERSQMIVPIKSLGLPNRPMGVCSMIVRPRGVRFPVFSSVKRNRFCFVRKKPGAMALTRILGEYSCAMCTASHWVKLLTAALAAAYAGVLVSGRKAFMEEMLRMEPPLALPWICRKFGWARLYREGLDRIPSEESQRAAQRTIVLARCSPASCYRPRR